MHVLSFRARVQELLNKRGGCLQDHTLVLQPMEKRESLSVHEVDAGEIEMHARQRTGGHHGGLQFCDPGSHQASFEHQVRRNGGSCSGSDPEHDRPSFRHRRRTKG